MRLLHFASFRQDGSYRPIESIDLVLMGDILDPLHSTRWLDTQSQTATQDPRAPVDGFGRARTTRPNWAR
jgi:hypothetical protein